MATTSFRARYPRSIMVGEKKVKLRPLEPGDDKVLLEYFRRLPVDERQMLKDDVTDPKTIRQWCKQINYNAVLPILVFADTRIVGNCTLHRHKGGWSSHVAKVRITLDPEFRGIGLGLALMKEVLDAAYALGVAIVDAEAMPEQKAALALLERLDFVTVATLPQHVVDLNHQPHDLVVMSRLLIPVERLSPDAWKKANEVDEGGEG